MQNQFWCKACDKMVGIATSRGAALLVTPLVGLVVGALPRVGCRRSSLSSVAIRAALGGAAAYLTNRYLVPRLQQQICGECGGPI